MKRKKIFVALGLILLNVMLAIFVVGNVAITAVIGNYIILDAGMFTETVLYEGQTHTWKCYMISGESTSIAVAWGEAPSAATGTIKVPSTITSSKPTGSSVIYDVVAIAKGGFSRCTMSAVEVPQSVTEIKEGAFSYCQELTTFQFPKDVTEIAPSTFLDCRKLTSVYYSDNTGKKTLSGGNITSIGDHAFDSCISLVKIHCPSLARTFGKSCFQNCKSLNSFRFPYDNEETGANRNTITVEEYAFEGCKDLHYVYFDVNMDRIAGRAFAECYADLTFIYCGLVIEDLEHPENNRDDVADFDTANPEWRNKYITDHEDNVNIVYNIIANSAKISEYNGLYYYLSDEDQPLDNARTDSTNNTTEVNVIENVDKKYVVIDHFEIPDDEYWDYDYYYEYDSEDPEPETGAIGGILKIPDSININGIDYTVKVIKPYAFSCDVYDLANLKEIWFNKSLVQIQNHAFYHSNTIRRLDFRQCTDLVEVSYSLFNEVEIVNRAGLNKNDVIDTTNDVDETATKSHTNNEMKSITLPNCLQYIGNFAFYNFTDLCDGIHFKTNPSAASSLRIIGDYAFATYSTSKTSISYTPTRQFELVLPNSLNDAYAEDANIYHSYAYDRKGNANGTTYATVHLSIANRFAINKNAFDHQLAIKSVTMEPTTDYGGTAHETSFGTSVFIRNPNLVRFQSNTNICLIGSDTFKQLSDKFRELFLYADTANNNSIGTSNPWGIADITNKFSKSLFQTAAYKNLVIYVQSSTGKAPKNQTNTWNVESVADYQHELKSENNGHSFRSTIPTHYVDWMTEGNVKYWHLKKENNTDVLTNVGPRDDAGYNDGYISLVKKKSNGKYTVARYFTDGNTNRVALNSIVDLTSSTLSGMEIDEIGPEAFGADGNNNLGKYFILPTTVATIRERAFYRSNNGQRVRLVTFATGDNMRTHAGTQSLSTFTTSGYSSVTDSVGGYCCLPAGINRVERVAFYNNAFTTVDIGSSLVFLGDAAFYSRSSDSTLRGVNTSFGFTDYSSSTTNTYFTVYNNGIYYTKEASKQTLLHYPNGLTSLTVQAGTKAIGHRAAASSALTSVTFNSDGNLTTIYGQAFMNCYNLESLSNVDSIKYICSFVDSPDTEVLSSNEIKFSSTAIFDQYDDALGTSDDNAKKNARKSAFEGCKKLQVDFEDFETIRKIGYRAFYGCSTLYNYNNATYTYKFYTDNDSGAATETLTKNVLDLSRVKTLRTIEAYAFYDCGISYAILPNTTHTSYNTQSQFYFGTGPNGNNGADVVFTKNTTKILCGETAVQACENGTGSLNPKTHYPLKSFNSNYSYMFFRTHSTADLVNAGATRRYWTAVDSGNPNEIHIILFSSKTAAETWLNDTSGNPTNANRQIHTFFEP